MKKQYLYALILCVLFLPYVGLSQTPAYLPKTDLIGWWPFDGDAKDKSGNGNNGTVSGPTQIADRFGKSNNAYLFDGVNDYIDLNYMDQLNGLEHFTFNVWVKSSYDNVILGHWISGSNPFGPIGINVNIGSDQKIYIDLEGGVGYNSYSKIDTSKWTMVTVTFNGKVNGNSNRLKLFINGQEDVIDFQGNIVPAAIGSQANSTYFGVRGVGSGIAGYNNGYLDDIGMWSRDLSVCEILDIFNSQLNSGRVKLTSNGANAIGSDYKVKASDSTKLSYQWQTDVAGIGWTYLKENSVYQGIKSHSLLVKKLTLSNHKQIFRVITTGTCVDTSGIVEISLADTCVMTVIDTVIVRDTILTTVIDTLLINVKYSGIGDPVKFNIIKVYPNPTYSHIVIDNGNVTTMNGFSVKILNSQGKSVYNQTINKQQFDIDLTTLGNKGVYFLQVMNKQGNIIEVKKIVLQ